MVAALLNVTSTIMVFYGTREYNNVYDRFRPSLVPALVPVMVIGDFLFLRQYRHAKARIAQLPEEEARRCRRRAWTLLWIYFALTIVFLGVAMVSKRV